MPDWVDGRPNSKADVGEGGGDTGPAGAHLQDARARRSCVNKRRRLLLLALDDSFDAIALEVLAGLEQAEVCESRIAVGKIASTFDVPLRPERPRSELIGGSMSAETVECMVTRPPRCEGKNLRLIVSNAENIAAPSLRMLRQQPLETSEATLGLEHVYDCALAPGPDKVTKPERRVES